MRGLGPLQEGMDVAAVDVDRVQSFATRRFFFKKRVGEGILEASVDAPLTTSGDPRVLINQQLAASTCSLLRESHNCYPFLKAYSTMRCHVIYIIITRARPWWLADKLEVCLCRSFGVKL